MKAGTVLIASKRARAYLRDILRVRYPAAVVMAHEEVAPRYQLAIIGRVEMEDGAQREQLLSATFA